MPAGMLRLAQSSASSCHAPYLLPLTMLLLPLLPIFIILQGTGTTCALHPLC